MKPRNKFEKAVLEQSKHLRPISKTQVKWAFRECIDHFGRVSSTQNVLAHCGYGKGLQSQVFCNRNRSVLVD